jgi:hypothetical protein
VLSQYPCEEAEAQRQGERQQKRRKFEQITCHNTTRKGKEGSRERKKADAYNVHEPAPAGRLDVKRRKDNALHTTSIKNCTTES